MLPIRPIVRTQTAMATMLEIGITKRVLPSHNAASVDIGEVITLLKQKTKNFLKCIQPPSPRHQSHVDTMSIRKTGQNHHISTIF